VKILKVNGVLPEGANIANGKYPLSRDLYMYTRSKPTGNTKKFIDWILSSEGQKIVKDAGFFPIK
jgi:phosphate transport system substrate-binding protein